MTFRTEFEEISLSGSDIVSQGQDRTAQCGLYEYNIGQPF